MLLQALAVSSISGDDGGHVGREIPRGFVEE